MDNIKEKDIINILKNFNSEYCPIKTNEQLDIIHDLFIKKQLQNKDFDDDVINYYYGLYFVINNDFNKAKTYLQKSIEKENFFSMYLLGKCYQNMGKHDEMKKNYLMAIKLNHNRSLNDLAYYYQYIEINYDLMKKYYLQAIDNGNSQSMYNLGYYYSKINDLDNAKKFFLMASDNNHISAMNSLGTIYSYEHDDKNTEKYYIMAFNNGCSVSIHNLADYYSENKDYEKMKECYELALQRGDPFAARGLGEYFYSIGDMKKSSEYIKIYCDLSVNK